jgi:hypothetical protein
MISAGDTMAQELESKVLMYHVQPLPFAPIDDAQRGLLARLDTFEAPYLEEKLMGEGVFTSKADYAEAFTEFKKFIGLVALYREPLAMSSKPVDEVWHQFILFTKKYHEFCKDFNGSYVHHLPRTSTTPLHPAGAENLRTRYRELYGDPSKLWRFASDCTSVPGGPDDSPSGHCSPSGGDDDD